MLPWIIGGLLMFVVLCIMFGAIPLANWYKRREARQALILFRIRREMLEARFFDLARVQGKPRDLRWVECDWQDEVTFARDRETGLLTAFVAVNIRFEAVEGGDMEDVAAVGTVRDAAAIFHYRDGHWGTGGRALFNMNPADALRSFAQQYAPLADILNAKAQASTVQ